MNNWARKLGAGFLLMRDQSDKASVKGSNAGSHGNGRTSKACPKNRVS